MNEKYPPTNPCTNCKGHSIWMLECNLDEKENRDSLIKALDNYGQSISKRTLS